MNTENVSIGKGRRIAGQVLIYLGSVVLIASAGAKFAHVPKVVNQLGAFGFEGSRLTMIAIAEVASALLFLIPATRSVGLLLVSSYLGGAIATDMQHGNAFFPPAVILSLLWLGAWLRHREVLWSLNHASSKNQFGRMPRQADALGGR